MSTERSRRRADGRSVKTKNVKNVGAKRKYQNSQVFSDETEDFSGIVLPPRYEQTGPKNVISKGTRYNLNGLLGHLFFWDRVAIPRPNKAAKLPEDFNLIEYCHNQTLSISENDDSFSFLLNKGTKINASTTKKAMCNFEPDNIVDLEWENQVQTFLALENKNPGLWSLADPFSQHHKLKKGRSLMVRLYDAIPVPAQDVSILQVVEFKERYRDELRNLRTQLAKLYLKIENSRDRKLAFNTEFSMLGEAISDVITSMEKSKLPLGFASIDARLYWNFSLPKSVAGGVIVNSLTDLEIALAAAVGGTVANLIPSFEVSASKGKVGRTGNPLAYAYLVSKSFGDYMPYDKLSSKNFLDKRVKKEEAQKFDRFAVAFDSPKSKLLDSAGLGTEFFLNRVMLFMTRDEAETFIADNLDSLSAVGTGPNVKKVNIRPN